MIQEPQDFGFNILSEEAVKEQELLLKKKIEEQTKEFDRSTKVAVRNLEKLYGLRDMILPLLNNLSKDSDKAYVYWPDRANKIKEFIARLNEYIEKE